MDHKERTKKQQEEAVQQELEQQLRDLGVTVSDAFRSGFDGYGDEIGRQAAQVGRSFTQLMNSVVGEVDDAFREAFGSERSQRREERRRRREARRSDGPGPYDYAADFGGPARGESRAQARPVPEEDYSKPLRRSAAKQFAVGLAMMICFGVLVFGGFLGSLACFIATEVVLEGTVGYNALLITGLGLNGIWIGSIVGMVSGGDRLEVSRLLNRCADVFAAMDVSQGIDLEDLAGLLQIRKKKLRKRLQEMMEKGWLAGWMDQREDCLYLSAADFRAAHNIPQAPEPQPAPEKEAEDKAEKPIHLDTARRFAQVLAQEQKLMGTPPPPKNWKKCSRPPSPSAPGWKATPRAPQGPAVCGILYPHHPEAAPHLQRRSGPEGGQRRSHPPGHRRHPAHLNTAYENLYDTLLSDAALDVSSEIAALEGMLASDGLTGEGLR